MSAMSQTVTRVVEGQLCTGCGLCASAAGDAIQMRTVAPGYSRPVQLGPVEPTAEVVIAAACPGNVVEAWQDAPSIDAYWGPWRRVGVAHATDPAVRFRASSGGGITGLALHALKAGLVDRVVHVAADPERPTRNIVRCSSDAEDILSGAGSRYASSSPLGDIQRVLADGGKVAFIGKPCDVSAVRRLGRVDERVAEHIPLMLSFFCAGVPSHDGADRVIGAMGLNPAEVVSFKYRGEGWPGRAKAVSADGRVAEMSYADSWGGHLSKEVQFRCKICPDAVGGVADIACADAWYGDEGGYPSFEEQEGRSLLLARTEMGERVLQQAIIEGDIVFDPIDIGEIDAMQPSQARRKRLIRSRVAALAATLQARPSMKGLEVEVAATRAGYAEELKSMLGTMRRIVQGRR